MDAIQTLLNNSEVKPKPASGVVTLDLPACRGFAANDSSVHQGCSGACVYDPSVKLFPGQYFDEETNLHYNHFRYYDPSTGRYIQSDRIGLYAGLNTYAYAAQNPLMYLDRYGLAEHTKNQRESNRNKHEAGNKRRGKDQGGEKADKRRRPPSKRPKNHKGPWPKQSGFARPGFLGGLSTGIGLLLWPNSIACAELDCDGDGLVDNNGIPLNSNGCGP